jgi:hypothetical protein
MQLTLIITCLSFIRAAPVPDHTMAKGLTVGGLSGGAVGGGVNGLRTMGWRGGALVGAAIGAGPLLDSALQQVS